MAAADLILRNARVVTPEPQANACDGIAIKGDHIAAVGAFSDLEGLAGPRTVIADCRGHTIVPGFIDAHLHVMATASRLLSLDCGPTRVRSIEDIKRIIAGKAGTTPEGRWIRCDGYNEFHLAEKRHPNRRDLDEAAGRHPVKLTHRSGHAIVLNSAAMALAGIGNETPEPAGGQIDRELSTGEPSGLLFGMDRYLDGLVPPPGEAEMEAAVREVNGLLLRRGITSVHDATGRGGAGQMKRFRKMIDQGLLHVRVYCMIGPEDLPEPGKRTLRGSPAGSPLRRGSLKIFLDEVNGRLNPSQEDLNELVCEAQHLGLQVAMHAVEEGTVRAAIRAMQEAQRRFPGRASRHRVEHCSVCPRELTGELARLKAMVVTQPSFVYNSGERYLATVPESQLPNLYAIKSLLDSGIDVAGSSDSPVGPPDPLAGMCAAVTRRSAGGSRISPEQAVTPLEVLRMFTVAGARASFEGNVKGRIGAGCLADLAILDGNPLTVPYEEIRDVRVLATLVGGRTLWEDPASGLAL